MVHCGSIMDSLPCFSLSLRLSSRVDNQYRSVADPEVGTLGVFDIMQKKKKKKKKKTFMRSRTLVFRLALLVFSHNNICVCTRTFVKLM